MAFSFNPDIDETIVAAAQRYGLDPNTMRAIAHIESRGNPNAQNPNSSAGGLYQFIDSTAQQYGLDDRFDPKQAADAGARLARDNSRHLQGVLGRQPSAGELYLAHQQGAGGASALLQDPRARAVDVVGADAVSLNGGNPNMTAGDFAQLWTQKADGLIGGPNAAPAPPVAGSGGAQGVVSNDSFMAALNRIRGANQPAQAQSDGQAEGPRQLAAQDRMAGIGAALMSLDQGEPPAQGLAEILEQARHMPIFNRQRGLSL